MKLVRRITEVEREFYNKTLEALKDAIISGLPLVKSI